MVSTTDHTTADRLRQEVCADAITRLGRARATLDRLTTGVGTVGEGDFVDAAMAGAATQILAIAERYG